MSDGNSMGNGPLLRPGEIQRMTAGTGVTHSESNPSKEESVHLYQIWILSKRNEPRPGHEQERFGPDETLNCLRLVVSPDGADGSLEIDSDTRLQRGVIRANMSVSLDLGTGWYSWVPVASGAIQPNVYMRDAGDDLAASNEPRLTIRSKSDAEVLVFDLP
jgi:hypothetical protein